MFFIVSYKTIEIQTYVNDLKISITPSVLERKHVFPSNIARLWVILSSHKYYYLHITCTKYVTIAGLREQAQTVLRIAWLGDLCTNH